MTDFLSLRSHSVQPGGHRPHHPHRVSPRRDPCMFDRTAVVGRAQTVGIQVILDPARRGVVRAVTTGPIPRPNSED